MLASALLRLSTPRPTALVTAFGVASAVALLERTRHPRATLLVVSACGVLPTLAVAAYPDFYASFVPALVAIYSVAVGCSPRESAIVPVVGVGIIVTFGARVPSFLSAGQLVYTVTGVVLAYAAGRTMRLLRHRADIEAARAEVLTREQEVLAREAVAAERERIARELHDVVAHDVAVMIVHAGAAERVLAQRPEQVAESLAQIQASGRKAVEELHLLLGMLNEPEPALRPRPGLHGVGRLVDELVGAGQPVSLAVTGQVRDIGDALDVSAYRLVQEALTNVLKHAPGSRTRIAVDYGLSVLTIAVVDEGSGAAEGAEGVGARLPSSGRGIAGMTERARLFGGTLTAGSRPAGGWAVRATLPIPSASR